MSNSYLQFCEALVVRSPEEEAWLRRYLDASTTDSEEHWGKAAGGDPFGPLTLEARWWDTVLSEDEEDSACFESRFTDLDGKRCLVFYSEDHAIVNHAAKLVQHFFKEMRPNGKDGFAISWAEICDKMQPGQFGGGACFITKDEIRWLHTWQWIDELAQHLHVE